jgi:hypothetical protein
MFLVHIKIRSAEIKRASDVSFDTIYFAGLILLNRMNTNEATFIGFYRIKQQILFLQNRITL